MEIGSVLEFLENKCIMVTGAAGFLAKILVEKILRVSNVKKLYLLLRASDEKSASQRFYNEILEKDLFKVLKEKNGPNLNSLISEKIKVVAGDITCKDLGLQDSKLAHDEMIQELDAIVNLAATTNFDERYDVALGINTMGAVHVLNFAKKCPKLEVLVHVSTAYVCGVKSGVIPETPYHMGETLNGVAGLDVDAEKMVVQQKLDQLQTAGASPESITQSMKDLGHIRAKMYGWPNTYVFTKAMGEMMVGSKRGHVPLVILRPTIITSTFSEPFPGWTEGLRTIDSLAVGYGKGKLTCFLGDLKAISDLIPADMVVNSILVSMAAQAGRESELIYQVGSSKRNPMRNSKIPELGYRYFTAKPWINKDGKPVKVGKVKVLSSMSRFHRYMAIHYQIPLKGLELVNLMFCKSFETRYRDLDKKINFVMRLVYLYLPYLFFYGVFDDTNTEKLRTTAAETGLETDLFYFDPKSIDWDDYFLNTHIPGLIKYVF